ncbi:MAG: OmpA family protein [Proteobacteria bacterium]|nr:OmpA family protein [Pseudomonadota bacterium]
MKTIQFLILVMISAFFAGCATLPPKELLNARSAFEAASEGPAAKLTPAELHKAQEALELAEQSFIKDKNSYKTRDLAYVAQRKAELAGAFGVMAADKEKKANADTDYQNRQTELVKQGKQDLIDSEVKRAEIEKQRKQDLIDSEMKRAEIEKQGKQDLIDSEKKTAIAIAELGKLAALKEEERGLVLTLSGSILFRSNESTLIPSAQVKLEQIANALVAVRERNLTVEGHTDSMGSEPYNQELSQRRASAVSDFLVKRGYPADRIQTLGKGEGHPIADNASAEGRANNRRVEIVIERDSPIASSYPQQ